eukprot:GHUV01000601.1.p1 GENE.GHUV01000601.1~~GHUV01000601.1.p1  ORF type:complete len:598 (+),score=306.21 GHUV01000601.1:86-1879(+)
MAATEEVPVEAPAAPEAAAAAPVFDDSYDESLLIKVKGKVKRPVRPDDTERNLQVQKLQEQIDKASGRMKEIKEILDSRSTGKGVVNPQQQAIRDRLQQLRGEFDAVVLQKRRLQSQNDDKKTERDKLIAEQRSIRDTIRGPSSLQAIDSLIQELEFKLNHESLSPALEKSTRERKERAERQDRPAAQRLAQVSAQIDECKAASEAIRAEVATFNSQLDGIKAARENEELKLQALRAEQAEARSDVPALIVEKKELWEVIQALRDKQREIRTAFNDKWEEFKKQNRAYQGWAAQERKKRQEQRKAEYEERQAARKAMDDTTRPAKYETEVYTCEQVLSYLRQFVSSEKSTTEEKKELEAPAPGMKLLSKKADAEADAMFAGTPGKKGKGARKAAEKAQKTADTGKKLPQVLPLETLKTFMSLGVDPPKTSDDVPRAIEVLEGKKKEFEEKRDKAAVEPPSEEEEEVPEEPPAEPAAAATAAEEETTGDAAATEENAAAEENGNTAEAAAEPEPAEEPAAAAAEPEEPKVEASGVAAADVPEANGNHEAATGDEVTDEPADATAAVVEETKVEETSSADGPIKLRITDAGEVKMEVQE